MNRLCRACANLDRRGQYTVDYVSLSLTTHERTVRRVSHVQLLVDNGEVHGTDDS